jgi:hypothetical protein
LLRLHIGIDFFAQFLSRSRQSTKLRIDLNFVAGFQHIFQLFDRSFDFFFFACFQFVTVCSASAFLWSEPMHHPDCGTQPVL